MLGEKAEKFDAKPKILTVYAQNSGEKVAFKIKTTITHVTTMNL